MGSVSGKNDKSHAVCASDQYIRRAHHAGSWYENDPVTLRTTLQQYLDHAASDSSTKNGRVNTSGADGRIFLRGLIVPHAGYSYSGPTAAYAYQPLFQELSRVDCPIQILLVLHPSHHVYLDGCAISNSHTINTPVGNLATDDGIREELLLLNHNNKSIFTVMSQKEDEEEHSGEMQYPYIAHILQACGKLHNNGSNKPIRVLPIMCGALSNQQEASYGHLLQRVIAREDVLTIVSSDFCHWGPRFRYQPIPTKEKSYKDSMPLHEFIKSLDRQGMDAIEAQQPGAFANYLARTRNTICGRHAIAVWMQAIAASETTIGNKDDTDPTGELLQVRFVRYAQSSPAESLRDNSVSYAAALATRTIAAKPNVESALYAL